MAAKKSDAPTADLAQMAALISTQPHTSPREALMRAIWIAEKARQLDVDTDEYLVLRQQAEMLYGKLGG